MRLLGHTGFLGYGQNEKKWPYRVNEHARRQTIDLYVGLTLAIFFTLFFLLIIYVSIIYFLERNLLHDTLVLADGVSFLYYFNWTAGADPAIEGGLSQVPHLLVLRDIYKKIENRHQDCQTVPYNHNTVASTDCTQDNTRVSYKRRQTTAISDPSVVIVGITRNNSSSTS